MTEWIVSRRTPMVVINHYIVEAASAGEAEEIVRKGGGEHLMHEDEWEDFPYPYNQRDFAMDTEETCDD